MVPGRLQEEPPHPLEQWQTLLIQSPRPVQGEGEPGHERYPHVEQSK